MATIIYNDNFYNREIVFCKVYSLESKKKLEKIFLKNRISFFVEWQERPWYRRIFDGHTEKGKNYFVIRINDSDAAKAYVLAQGIESVQMVRMEKTDRLEKMENKLP